MDRSGSGRRRHGRADGQLLDEFVEGVGGNRIARLEELILRELAGLLRDEIGDPNLQPVRLVKVVLSVDYRHARVHYAVVAEPRGRDAAPALDDGRGAVDRRALGEALRRATPFLRARLADGIDLKRVPDLRFVLDAEVAD